MRTFIFLLLNFLVVQNLSAQTISRDSVAGLLQNIAGAMEVYHPDPYHYNDSTALAELRTRLVRVLPETVDTLQLYRSLNLYVCAYGDAHTRVYGSEALNTSRQNARVLPFDLTLREDELWIRHDYRNSPADLSGKRITEINGLTVAQLDERMRRHANRETISLDRVVLSQQFSYYHWLSFNNITYRLRFADGTQVEVEGISLQQLSDRRPATPSGPVLETSYPGNGVAVLTIRHFNASPKYFKKRFREIFREIRAAGSTTLILDLRGHDGGDARVGVELARYFSPVEFRPFAYSEWRVTPAFRQAFEGAYLPGILSRVAPLIKGFNPHLRAIYNAEDHTNARVDYPVAKPYGKGRRFAGEVVLLTDEQTFSAGTCFAAMFKDYQMGTIVGRESGNLASFYADAMLRMGLPHGMLLRISTSYLVRPSGNEAVDTVQPDVRVEGDVLEFVLQEYGG